MSARTTRPLASTRRRRATPGVVDSTPDRAPLDGKLAARRYRTGWTYLAIAREAGYSVQTVRRELARQGVAPRPRRAPREDARLLRTLWRGLLARAAGRTPSGRRIGLHAPWRDFAAFATFARRRRYRPGRALVRLDPERPFAPDNVRFVPVAEVSRHTAALRRPVVQHLLTAFGETKGLMEWARDRRCLVTASTLSTRLHCGMAPEAAIATPPQKGRRGLLPRPERRQVPIRAATDWARARRLYLGGADLMSVALAVGRSRTAVREGLRRLGVELRDRGTLTITRHGKLLCQIWSAMRARAGRAVDPRGCARSDPRGGARGGARGGPRGGPRGDAHGAARGSARAAGGPGVCRAWQRFAAFHDWALAAGWKPGLLLVRTDERRPFAPGNCRFVRKAEVARWRRRPRRTRAPYVLVTAFGETRGMTAWARDPRCVVSATTLSQRLRAGRRPEEALTEPPRIRLRPAGRRFITAFGETRSLARWARDRRCRVTTTGLRLRLDRGVPPERAIATPPWGAARRRRGEPIA